MSLGLAVLIAFALLIAGSVGVANLVARFSVERDEDEELLHPIARVR